MTTDPDTRLAPTTQTSLDEHPESRRLRIEIDSLARELAERLAELHDLQHIIRPNLLALYQTKLGRWELHLLEAQCEAARWKRRGELARAALNRGEMFDLMLIDLQLEKEFVAWKERVADATARIGQAEFRLSHTLEPADDAALKKLFRQMARQLHPDLNPQPTDNALSLWNEVLAAYESADLQKLEALAIIAAHQASPPEPSVGLEGLRQEHQRLRSSLDGIYRHLREVRKQPPYSLAAQWRDEAWLAGRRAEIEAQIAAAKAQAQAFRDEFSRINLGHGNGQQPGLN